MNATEAQEALVDRYRLARREWVSRQDIRDAARLLGLSEREYCDRHVRPFGPITFSSGGTGANPSACLDTNQAFDEAAPLEQGVPDTRWPRGGPVTEKELQRLLQALAERARIAYETLTIHVADGHVHHVTGSETGKPGSLGRLFPGASMT